MPHKSWRFQLYLKLSNLTN